MTDVLVVGVFGAGLPVSTFSKFGSKIFFVSVLQHVPMFLPITYKKFLGMPSCLSVQSRIALIASIFFFRFSVRTSKRVPVKSVYLTSLINLKRSINHPWIKIRVARKFIVELFSCKYGLDLKAPPNIQLQNCFPINYFCIKWEHWLVKLLTIFCLRLNTFRWSFKVLKPFQIKDVWILLLQ